MLCKIILHLQKIVHRAEEREHSLFSRVRNAEYARQKQEQSVRKAQQELYEIKRQNAQKIKEEMSQLTKQEQELEQKLLREQAQLAKVSFVIVVFTKVRSMFSQAYVCSGGRVSRSLDTSRGTVPPDMGPGYPPSLYWHLMVITKDLFKLVHLRTYHPPPPPPQPPSVLTSSGSHQKTNSWEAGGTHPSGMLFC